MATGLERWGSGDGAVGGHRHLKIDSSMRALSVVVADVVPKYSFEMSMAHNENPVEAFSANRPHPAFRERISLRRSDRRLDHPDALGAEYLVEAGGEFGVPIPDEELEGAPSVDEIADHVAGNLGYECIVWMFSDAEDVHLPG